jgi:tetratricopeptide (TPR) repeat protein
LQAWIYEVGRNLKRLILLSVILALKTIIANILQLVMLKIKSLYQELESCNDDLKRVELLAELSTEFINSDLNRCTEVVQQMGDLAKKLGDPKALGYYYSGLGRIHFKLSQFQDAIRAYNIAIDYAKAANAPMLESNCCHSLGMVYWIEGAFDKSLELSLKALSFFKSIEQPSGNEAMCYNNVGNIYERMGDYDKAEEAYQQGYDIAKASNEPRLLNNLMGNLGVIKLRKKQYKDALDYLEPVYKGFKEMKHVSGELLTLSSVGQAYVGLGQYAKGMKFYLEALKLLKTNDFKAVEADVYRGLGDIYMGMDGYDEAMKHYEKGMEIVKSIDYYSGICTFYADFAKVRQAQGNINAALEAVNTGLELAKGRKLPKETLLLEETKARLLSEQTRVA